MRRGLVLGCGGPLGFAWTAVALGVVEDALGWDAREAVVLQGTSAGAEMAALLGSGVSVCEIVSELDAVAEGRTAPAPTPLSIRLTQDPPRMPPVPRPTLPALGLLLAAAHGHIDRTAGLTGLLPRGRGEPGFLRRFGDALASPGGWVLHPGVRLVAADARSGELVAFGSEHAPKASLAAALAASWAIPAWFPPVSIGSRRYLDGGTVSPTSAHLIAGLELDEVVIVAPMSTHGGAAASGLTRAERVLRRAMTRRVDHEATVLADRGIRVLRVEPGAGELAAMGANFMDVRRRAATLRAARQYLPVSIENLLERPS